MSSPRILVVDDEPDIRDLVHDILEDEGYEVHVAATGAEAREVRLRERPDLILLDIWMPDVDGVTLLKEWIEEGGPSCPVVMISGHGTVETAVEATRLGAHDFIEKPLSLAKLLLTVERALSAAARKRPAPATNAPDIIEPVGRSPSMRMIREQARRLAAIDSWLLISGESGSGKRTIARFIHHLSGRTGPLLEFNAEAGYGDETGPVLFGVVNGGRERSGLLARAAGGTLIIHSAAALPSEIQARLVGALETGHFFAVGGAEPLPLSLKAHVIVTLHQSPEAELSLGRLRADFYDYLNVAPLRVPALREHREDVSELLAFWVDRLVEREQLPFRRFTLAAQNRLRNYEWPGNVRELRNFVERLLLASDEEEITVEEVERALAEQVPAAAAIDDAVMPLDMPLRDAREHFERVYLQHQLKRAQGSVAHLARLTGMERTHLYRKLKALGIDPKETS